MANIKSQKKRILTNEKRRVRNQSVKSELKTLVRQTREAVEAGDKEKALAALRIASRKLDVAVSKGVIHKNQAANRKSKLARRVASLGPPWGRPAFVYPLPRARPRMVGAPPHHPTLRHRSRMTKPRPRRNEVEASRPVSAYSSSKAPV